MLALEVHHQMPDNTNMHLFESITISECDIVTFLRVFRSNRTFLWCNNTKTRVEKGYYTDPTLVNKLFMLNAAFLCGQC